MLPGKGPSQIEGRPLLLVEEDLDGGRRDGHVYECAGHRSWHLRGGPKAVRHGTPGVRRVTAWICPVNLDGRRTNRGIGNA